MADLTSQGMRATSNTYSRAYPLSEKGHISRQIHSVESVLNTDWWTPATHKHRGIRLWGKINHPDYHRPEPSFSQAVPRHQTGMVPAAPKNRRKPVSDSGWTPVFRRDTARGTLTVTVNKKREWRFSVGDFTSLATYANKESVIQAVKTYLS